MLLLLCGIVSTSVAQRPNALSNAPTFAGDAVKMRIVESWRASRVWLRKHVFHPEKDENALFAGTLAAGLEPAKMEPDEIAAFPFCATAAVPAHSHVQVAIQKRMSKFGRRSRVRKAASSPASNAGDATPLTAARSESNVSASNQSEGNEDGAVSSSRPESALGGSTGGGDIDSGDEEGAPMTAEQADMHAQSASEAADSSAVDVDAVLAGEVDEEKRAEQHPSSSVAPVEGGGSGSQHAALDLSLQLHSCPFSNPPMPQHPLIAPAERSVLPKLALEMLRVACKWAKATHAPAERIVHMDAEGNMLPQAWDTTCLDANQAYLDVRNHILLRWIQRPGQLLSAQDAIRGLPEHWRVFSLQVFFFLAVSGRVNYGAVPFPALLKSALATSLQRSHAVDAPESALKVQLPGPRCSSLLPMAPQLRHVVVVGAGIAGLSSARMLLLFGYRVTVLEARSRVGGRVHTVRHAVGCNADAGAMVTTGDEPNAAAFLARQASLPVHNMSDSTCRILMPLQAVPDVAAFNSSHLEATIRGMVVGGVIAYFAYQSLVGPRLVGGMTPAEAEDDILETLQLHKASGRGKAITCAGLGSLTNMGRVPPALWRRLCTRQEEAAEIAAAVQAARDCLNTADVVPRKFFALVPPSAPFKAPSAGNSSGGGGGSAKRKSGGGGSGSSASSTAGGGGAAAGSGTDAPRTARKRSRKASGANMLSEGSITKTYVGNPMTEFEAGLFDDLLRGELLPDVNTQPKGDVSQSLASLLRAKGKAGRRAGATAADSDDEEDAAACSRSGSSARFPYSTLYHVVAECLRATTQEQLRLSQHVRLLRRVHAVLDACASDAVGASETTKRVAQSSAMAVGKELSIVCDWLGMPMEWHLIDRAMAVYVGDGDTSAPVPGAAQGVSVLAAVDHSAPQHVPGGGVSGSGARRGADSRPAQHFRLRGYAVPRALDSAAERQFNALLEAAHTVRTRYKPGGALPPALTACLPEAKWTGAVPALASDVKALVSTALLVEEDPENILWVPGSNKRHRKIGDDLSRCLVDGLAAHMGSNRALPALLHKYLADAAPTVPSDKSTGSKKRSRSSHDEASSASKRAAAAGGDDTPVPAEEGEEQPEVDDEAAAMLTLQNSSQADCAALKDFCTDIALSGVGEREMWGNPSALLRACGVILRGWSRRSWDTSLGAAVEFVSKLRGFVLAHNAGVPLERVLPPHMLQAGVLSGIPLSRLPLAQKRVSVYDGTAPGMPSAGDAAPVTDQDGDMDLGGAPAASPLVAVLPVAAGLNTAQLQAELAAVLHLECLPLPTPQGEVLSLRMQPQAAFTPARPSARAGHGVDLRATAAAEKLLVAPAGGSLLRVGHKALMPLLPYAVGGDAAVVAALELLQQREETAAGSDATPWEKPLTPAAVTHALMRWHVSNLEYGCAAPLNRVSLRHWDQDDAENLHNHGSHTMLKCGYDGLIGAIARDVPVQLQSPVSRIVYTCHEDGEEYIGAVAPFAPPKSGACAPQIDCNASRGTPAGRAAARLEEIAAGADTTEGDTPLGAAAAGSPHVAGPSADSAGDLHEGGSARSRRPRRGAHREADADGTAEGGGGLGYGDTSQTGVRVELQDGSAVAADAVVVTLPLGCLQAGDVAFEPPLPKRKQAAVQALGNGLLNKVILRFATPFWRAGHGPIGQAAASVAAKGAAAAPTPAASAPSRGTDAGVCPSHAAGDKQAALSAAARNNVPAESNASDAADALVAAAGADSIPEVPLLPGMRLHAAYLSDELVRKACALLLKSPTQGAHTIHDMLDALLVSGGCVQGAITALTGRHPQLQGLAAGTGSTSNSAAPVVSAVDDAASAAVSAELPAAAAAAVASGAVPKEAVFLGEAGVEDIFGRAQLDDGEPRGASYMFWALDRLTGGDACLIAMMAGEAAEWVEGTPDSDVLAHVLGALRSLFGASTPAPEAHYITRWGSDPFSRGAYSHLPVGSTGHVYDLVAAPVGKDNCVCFAGEATNKRHPTTVSGAFETGIREAVRLHSQLSGWGAVDPRHWAQLAQGMYPE